MLRPRPAPGAAGLHLLQIRCYGRREMDERNPTRGSRKVEMAVTDSKQTTGTVSNRGYYRGITRAVTLERNRRGLPKRQGVWAPVRP
jgi:hypothetical protein